MKNQSPVTCPKACKCNLFQDKILQGESKDNVYKLLYCNTKRYRDCRRYQIFREAGSCPDFIMPNSKHGTDYILRKIEEEITNPEYARFIGHPFTSSDHFKEF